jgi:hypothetical protein
MTNSEMLERMLAQTKRTVWLLLNEDATVSRVKPDTPEAFAFQIE